MMSFRLQKLRNLNVSVEVMALLKQLDPAQQQLELLVRQTPQLLDPMQGEALRQSAQSLHRLEGVTDALPRSRQLQSALDPQHPELKIESYASALLLVSSKVGELFLIPDLVQRLHGIIQEGDASAGVWRDDAQSDAGTAPPGRRITQVAAAEVPVAMRELCWSFRHALDVERVPPLFGIACFHLDFLCIDPFQIGNIAVAHLLTQLGLLQSGHVISRYVSLEKQFAASAREYAKAFRRSSGRWLTGRHDVMPWIGYFLKVLYRSYQKLGDRIQQMQNRSGGKTAFVEAIIAAAQGDFTLLDLEAACPGIRRDLIRWVLRDLRKQGRVVCVGRGPGAPWRKVHGGR